ncbi:hypothetical protein [Pseudoroseicyclus aestuarii]|uniref:3-deoxy-7-phosphoheptulonate synthase n=1 Tax=Pseudoroseicyclus aestuarii TaxID=1795041 RepID=A0A318SVW6_9RHOB|nr:hypothetical protein [Pseudoroseicyclus aestuarii]PYE85743.1 hypothetical protein DFP88_101415 [Pseudoroseicyclus aestuarii]
MAEISMTIVLTQTALSRPEEARARIEAVGVRISRYLPEVGILTGSGEERLLETLRHLGEVAQARPEHRVSLPPLSGRRPQ